MQDWAIFGQLHQQIGIERANDLMGTGQFQRLQMWQLRYVRHKNSTRPFRFSELSSNGKCTTYRFVEIFVNSRPRVASLPSSM